ncbi:hypothetical protein BY458DRAFT_500399 [Sporodiniella umbellata]|nr:hypothetical protein BY458DRAFT_500399 [Sporodiniella umbellata]
MDVGELKNPFSSDKNQAKKTETGTSGLFKIGDYDEKPKSKENEGVLEQVKEKVLPKQ